MSDEEREAVEYWKTYMQILHWNTQLASEHYIKVLLDLVEKQSKEIEELKNKNKKLQDKCKELIFEKQELTSALLDSTPNDKIKSKIDYLLKHYDSENFINFEMFIKILQSLLEKE